MTNQAPELLDDTPVPGGGIMELFRRGADFVICVDHRELMCDRMHASEDALADLACARLTDRPEARVLVGGLGMGFTLAAALKGVGPEGKVVVAELVPGIVKWNRGVLGESAGYPLLDPRASVHEGDVAELIRNSSEEWDAILLDVDNGPVGLTRSSNNWLYTWEGLESAYRALTPGGILGVWSAWPDNGFTRRVDRAGFDVTPVEVRARGSRGGHLHTIWIGEKRAEAPRWMKSPSG